jgi:DNA-binding transcriptional regulator/RsmH inhibitor MraZ
VPRRDRQIANDPFRTWVVTVDQYNRIRLPLDVCDIVRWVNPKSEKLECIGTPGPWGGVQLVPLTDHQADVQRLAEAIADAPPSASESSQEWVDVARFLATAWLIPIHVEANRISITLPEPPRRAQQLPAFRGTAVVFGFGNILEIWDALKWHDHVRATAKRKAAAISEALEDLGQR